jgi:AcrR family transcriptional regulator
MNQPRRTQRERRAETSARLVEATIECLLEQGYAGAGVKEICSRAGVTTGAIQHNFGSKQGLMIAVVKKMFRGFDDGIELLGADRTTLDERIDNIFEHYWMVYTSDQYYAVCEVLLAVRRDTELLRLNKKIREDWLRAMGNFLEIEFPEVTLDVEQKRALVLDMIDYLRGFCIRRIYGLKPEIEAAAKQRARAMVADAFHAACQKASRAGTQ